MYIFVLQCAQSQGIDYAPIKTCANGKMGNALEHEMAEVTDALNPPHRYVPWVTLNDASTVQSCMVHNSADLQIL